MGDAAAPRHCPQDLDGVFQESLEWEPQALESSYPSTVLGASAARRLGVVEPGTQVWLGGTSFTVVGIFKPSVLAPELDNAALIGAPVAERLFGYAGNPTTSN